MIYALYHAPVEAVRALLEQGADPREAMDDGFPPLFAALGSNRPDRAARVAVLREALAARA